MIGASSEDIRLRDKIEITKYGLSNSSVNKKKAYQYVSASTNASMCKNVLDNNQSTVWSGSKGEFISFELKDKAVLETMEIVWGKTSSGSKYEIQVSNGGGQFLPVVTGNIKSGSKEKIMLNNISGSDLRILLLSGSSIEISEVMLPAIKND